MAFLRRCRDEEQVLLCDPGHQPIRHFLVEDAHFRRDDEVKRL